MYINNPCLIFVRIIIKLDSLGFSIPDKLYLSCYYRYYVGKKLDWDNPKKFCEKLNWLKLYDHNPLYTNLVDKVLVKQYVAEKIGKQYIIPTLATYSSAEEIKWSELPNKFVIKCNHDSASYIICKDKSKLNLEKATAKLHKSINTDFYRIAREWAYKNVKRKILVEEYLEDPTGDLKDYKFFCFDGKVKALFIASDRQSKDKETCFDFFDPDYIHLPMTSHHPNAEKLPQKPQNFELMKELAEKLSIGIPHVRIDFYEYLGKVYFGEFTFYHDGAYVPMEPEEYEYKFGSWINLSSK